MPSPRISVDISLYPLTPDYKAPIIAFINKLRRVEGCETLANPLSTQIYGPFDLVWGALGTLLPEVFGEDFTSIVVLKVVSVDVNG